MINRRWRGGSGLRGMHCKRLTITSRALASYVRRTIAGSVIGVIGDVRQYGQETDSLRSICPVYVDLWQWARADPLESRTGTIREPVRPRDARGRARSSGRRNQAFTSFEQR